MISGNAAGAGETEINAGWVLDNMIPEERSAYVAGVVEGLAYSRYLRSKPDQSGMKCVYDWYKNTDVSLQTRQLFERHPDKPVGVILHALIKRECGE